MGTLQEKLAAAEREAESLRRMLAAYPDVQEVDGRYEAAVPFEHCSTAEVFQSRSTICVRFGHDMGVRGETVWSPQVFAVDNLLTWALESDEARAALCKVLAAMDATGQFP